MVAKEVFQKSFFEKNIVLDWVGVDNIEHFNKVLKNSPNNESLIFYKNNPIKYQLNNFGFRTYDDFDNKSFGNIFLGCSMTMGVGLSLENVWSYQLNKLIGNDKFWNLSLPGCGIMTAFRLLYGFSDYLKIKNIFMFFPKWPRYEVFDENNNPRDYSVHNFGEYKTILTNDANTEIIFNSYYLAIERLAQKLDVHLYFIGGEKNLDGVYELDKNGLEARDLIHPTVNENKNICKVFLEKFQKNEFCV